MNEQRERWLETLFSTDPADREAAESGVRAFYEAAELEFPRQIVWLDSPAEACYAALLLCTEHEPLLRQITAAFEKMPGPRAELARIREKLRQVIGAADWNAASVTFGAPLAGMGAPARHDFQGKITLTRIGLWKDASAAMGKVSEDELFIVETRFWGVIEQGLQTQGTMMQGSVSRKYHLAWMARDEAVVGSEATPPLLVAAWKVARSAGPWWAFRNAAIITDRPLEVHRNAQWLLERGEGPAIRYRDGWRAFAWNGYSMPEKWIMQPESIPARQLKQADKSFQAYLSTRLGAGAVSTPKVSSKPSSILKTELPRDAETRVEFFRKHASGGLPLYERYQKGERREVWKQLIGLGAAVRTEPYAADALAVAYETMCRVDANVRVLVERLHAIGYQFATDQSEWEEREPKIESALAMNPPVSELGLRSPHVRGALEMMEAAKAMLRERLDTAKKLTRDTSVRAHIRPGRDAAKQIQKLEKKLGTLPLSLRAFYEVVGSIDLMGQHVKLTPRGAPISPDPLVVFSVEDALAGVEELEEADEAGHIFIAPDEIHKAGKSGGEPYEIAVPDERADGEVLNERHGIFFVEYLRMAFRFGGFPGYEGYDQDLPKEIEELREGLLEF